VCKPRRSSGRFRCAGAAILSLSVFMLASCGGGGGTSQPKTPTHTVWVYVSGLSSPGLVLSYSSGASQAIAHNGPSVVAGTAPMGSTYDVAIAAQPANQTCVLGNGTGTVGSADVTSITVFCPQSVGRNAYLVTRGDTKQTPTVLGTISLATIDPQSGALTLVSGGRQRAHRSGSCLLPARPAFVLRLDAEPS
jgi:hypothetical protein